MSHTSTRLTRLAAGLTVAAAVTATTLLGAAPAYAQSNDVLVRSGSGIVIVEGSNSAESLTVRPEAVAGVGIRVSSSSGNVLPGSGCTAAGAGAVVCTGTKEILYFGRAGNDSFFNLTSLPSSQNGGDGDDKLLGGQGDDQLLGQNGFDTVIGSGGTKDRCVAESERRCEL